MAISVFLWIWQNTLIFRGTRYFLVRCSTRINRVYILVVFVPVHLKHAMYRNPVTYQGALTHLSLSDAPHKAAMVAAHIYDLRAAAKVGLKTIYVHRPGEETNGAKSEEVKSKEQGGEVDVVVQDFLQLARLFQTPSHDNPRL